MTRAIHIETMDEFREKRIAGSFHCAEPDSDDEIAFWYCCPCGCRRIAPLNVGKGFKPSDPPSWLWNGSFELATLTPSVHHVNHWHGYLTGGIWQKC